MSFPAFILITIIFLTNGLVLVRSDATTKESKSVIYIDCKKSDTINGEQLGTIVGYVIKGMNTSGQNDYDLSQQEKYNQYCQALGTKLGGYEPYMRNLELGQSEETTKEEIVRKITRVLPRSVPEFESAVVLVAEKAMKARLASFRVDSFIDVFYRKQKYEADLSEFVVVKVFRAAENLEIIPCLLKLSCKGKAVWYFGIPAGESSEIFLHYEERKYILTKFAIKNVMRKINELAERSWS